MKYTKQELDELKNDHLMQFITSLFGTNLNEIVENAKKELEEEEKKNDAINNTQNVASKLEETLRKMEKDGLINNVRTEPIQKKEYKAPKCENGHSFIMSKEQFVKFVNKYTELVNSLSKLSYLFGISFDVAKCNFNFATTISEIIWDFVRLIFGDDNADDIADFIYGNSNFDSAENLYDELV